MYLNKCLCLLTAGFLLSGTTRAAEMYMGFSVTELVIRASIIAEVMPLANLKGSDQVRFKVLAYYKNAAQLPGDTVVLSARTFHYDLYDRVFPFEKALFFLTAREDSSGNLEPELIFSGLRLLRRDSVFLPFQRDNPGPFLFVPAPFSSWQSLLQRVRIDVERIDAVLSLKSIEPAKARNRTLFQWIYRTRSSFYGHSSFYDDAYGWGSLEYKVFDWIKSEKLYPDTYLADWLNTEIGRSSSGYKQLNHRTRTLTGDWPLLLEIAADTGQLIDHRVFALDLLATALTDGLPPPGQDSIARFLLQKRPHSPNGFAGSWLRDSSLRPGTLAVLARLARPWTALPAPLWYDFQYLYRQEPPGAFRRELGEFLAEFHGENAWKGLSGNGGGLLLYVLSSQFNPRENQVEVALFYAQGKEVVKGLPEVSLTRNDGELTNFRVPADWVPAETWRTLPLGPDNRLVWLQLSAAALPAGKWTLRLWGVAGPKNEFSWHTEPVSFEIQR